MAAFRAVSQERVDQPFYLMRDVMCGAFDRFISNCGHSVTPAELGDLENQFWLTAIPTAVTADGAIETLSQLREAGILTGIVSYADTQVFDGLLRHTGLAGLTDVEVCSEMARSCKPHPAIFAQALHALDTDPSGPMFVGDTVETDIVGASRLGMRTALLSAGEFTLGAGPGDHPETQPDYHLNHLLDVVDIVFGNPPPSAIETTRVVTDYV